MALSYTFLLRFIILWFIFLHHLNQSLYLICGESLKLFHYVCSTSFRGKDQEIHECVHANPHPNLPDNAFQGNIDIIPSSDPHPDSTLALLHHRLLAIKHPLDDLNDRSRPWNSFGTDTLNRSLCSDIRCVQCGQLFLIRHVGWQ